MGDGDLAAVHYLCAPGQTRNAVERAVERMGADSVVAVFELKETQATGSGESPAARKGGGSK